MQKEFLALFGHVVMDVTMRVDRLPTSGTVGINSMVQNFGGTAGNFAMVAARLGFPFHLYSAVSRSTHSQYLEFLSKIGVDISHIVVDHEDMGPIGYAATTGEEQIFYFYQGPMEKSLYDRIKPVSLNYDYIHFGTGLPEDFMKFSKLAGISKIVFDPGQEISYRYDSKKLEPLIEMSHITILNQLEFETAARILSISKEGLESRCTNLIVTKGKEGSVLYRNGEAISFPALAVEKPYDTIGAGDSYRAGLYLGLKLGKTLEESMIIGTVTSSEALKRPLKEFSLSGDHILEIYEANRENLLPK